MPSNTERALNLTETLSDVLEGQPTDVAMTALISVLSAYVHSAASKDDRPALLEFVSERLEVACRAIDGQADSNSGTKLN